MFGETFKNFKFNLNALNERNTITGGDPITGTFSFDLAKTTNISSIAASLTGKANVHWTVKRSSGGGRRRRRRTHTQSYRAALLFFDLKIDILREDGAIRQTGKLQPGTHLYPFAFQLPRGDFPPAINLVNGKIVYALTVEINRPWHLAKSFETQLNFVQRINTNTPELQAPLSGTNSMTLCWFSCASGPITMTANLEKKAFVPGETVRMICVFSNCSSRTATPQAKLKQTQHFYTKERLHHRVAVKNLVFVTGEPVRAHISDMNTELMLTIPQITPPTISNCSILVVDYMIELSLSVRCAHELTVLFPIILCEPLIESHPPVYQ